MSNYRKLQLAALAVEFITLLARAVVPLPDWALQLNGVVMLVAVALLAFTSVRLSIKNS